MRRIWMGLKHSCGKREKQVAANTALLAVLIALLPFTAQGSPVFMGNIESVYPDSLTNALRSPALVPAQSGAIETGLTMKYKAYYKSTAGIDADLTSLDGEALKPKSLKNFGATAYYSLCFRSGGTGFGLGITATDDDQVMRSTDRVELSGYISGFPNSVRSENTEKKSSLNPSLSLSLGTKTGEMSYAGFKVVAGYSASETETVEKFSVDSVLSTSNRSTTKSVMYSLELQLGFFTRDGDSQAGLLVKSGNVDLKKSEVEYREEVTGTPSGSGTIQPYTQMKKGPALVAGGYTKLLPFLGVSMEGEYRMPAYYYEKGFEKGWDGNYHEEKMRKFPMPEYHARGGVEFIVSPSIQFLLGGGFVHSGSYGVDKNPDGSRRKEESYEFKVYYGQSGVNLRITEGSRLVLGGLYSRLKVKGRMDSSDMHMELRQDMTIVNAFLGISLAY